MLRLLELLVFVFILVLGLTVFGGRAQLTEEEKEEIVWAHNSIRGKVDPVASNMEQMVKSKHKSKLLQPYACFNCNG